MTNITAAIIITLSTNWVTIGTFTPARPATEWGYADYRPSFEVQQGNIVTNMVAVMEWKGEKKLITLESTRGPSVGERKIEQSITNWFPRFPSFIVTNLYQ